MSVQLAFHLAKGDDERVQFDELLELLQYYSKCALSRPDSRHVLMLGAVGSDNTFS